MLKSVQILARSVPVVLVSSSLFSVTAKSSLCLEPIGQALPSRETPYSSGQLILDRHLGYRGIVLNAWPCKLFDKNIALENNKNSLNHFTTAQSDGRPVFAYTVLTDNYDIDLCHSLKSGISFLSDDCGSGSTVYVLPDMDYAFHEDLIPYTSNASVPIKNNFLQEFIRHDPQTEPHYFPRDNLQRWIEAKWASLEIKNIYRETTEGIRVTAIPFLIGRRKFRWRYLIRIENLTDECLQLRERFWKVFSITGNLESVTGKGVVGVQPTLSPESPVFQYHSHIQLPVAWGHMWGIFRLERTNGSTLDVKIPTFQLCDKDFRQPPKGAVDDSGGNV